MKDCGGIAVTNDGIVHNLKRRTTSDTGPQVLHFHGDDRPHQVPDFYTLIRSAEERAKQWTSNGRPIGISLSRPATKRLTRVRDTKGRAFVSAEGLASIVVLDVQGNRDTLCDTPDLGFACTYKDLGSHRGLVSC